MSPKWEDDIRARFPDWGTDGATARWPETRSRLSIGQEVNEEVIARTPFGVWVDIGVGHPAGLLVPEMAAIDDRPIRFDDYPAIGTSLNATIVALGDNAEISLSQFPAGSKWFRLRPKNPSK